MYATRRSKLVARKPDLVAALPDHSSYHSTQHLSRAAMAGKDGSGGGLPGFPGAGGSGAPFDFSALQGILNVRVANPVSQLRPHLLA